MKRNNWNKENIILFIENEVGYTFIDFKEFKNSNSIVTVMCEEGHVYSVNFNSLRKGRKCRKCSGSMKYTLEEVQLYLKKYLYCLHLLLLCLCYWDLLNQYQLRLMKLI